MFNKMSLYRVKKGFVYLRYFGPKEFLIRLKERIRIQKIDYEKCISCGACAEACPRKIIWSADGKVGITEQQPKGEAKKDAKGEAS